MFRHSMFGVFEVQYFGVRSKTTKNIPIFSDQTLLSSIQQKLLFSNSNLTNLFAKVAIFFKHAVGHVHTHVVWNYWANDCVYTAKQIVKSMAWWTQNQGAKLIYLPKGNIICHICQSKRSLIKLSIQHLIGMAGFPGVYNIMDITKVTILLHRLMRCHQKQVNSSSFVFKSGTHLKLVLSEIRVRT